MKLLAIVICISIFSFNSSEGGGEWELKYDSRGRGVWGIHFITPQVGWALGLGERFAENKVYWTEDGGESWGSRDLNPAPDHVSFFLNALDGWRPDPVRWAAPYPPMGVQLSFRRSFDGGLSWEKKVGVVTEVISMNDPPQPMKQIEAYGSLLYFLDSQIGWIFGSTLHYGHINQYHPDAFRAHYIGKTTDGGKTWSLHLNWLQGWRAFETWFKEIEFSDAQHGWILGNFFLYRTNDGGRTWHFSGDPSQPHFFQAIEFPTPQEGWLGVGNRLTQTEELWHTRDGGQTWEVIWKVTHGGIKDIVFINSQQGWISLTHSGITPLEMSFLPQNFYSGIIHTRDGGLNWEVELELGMNTWISDITYDRVTGGLWASGTFIYKRRGSLVGVFPRGKLPLTWGQLKNRR